MLNDDPIVFIVDGDPTVREGLMLLVKSMRLRAKSYVSGQEFLRECDPAQPGCLLLDVRSPQMSGLGLLDRLSEEEIHLPAIILSAHGDVPMVVQAMKAGALNFLEKPCRDQELWEAIREALEWDKANRRRLARLSKISRRLARLTPGEHEVLQMLVEGKSNRIIAAELGVSVRTVEVRRAKLMRKMRANSFAHLVRLTMTADAAPQ